MPSVMNKLMTNLSKSSVKFMDSLRLDSKHELSAKQKRKRAENSLERTSMRLDGFEMYAFVASLAAGFSFSGLDTLGSLEHWPEILILPFSASVVISIFSGLYSTLIFCLCSLYSKTALAEGKDLRMATFLHR